MKRVGSYELIEEIARGGMGAVYRARTASGDPVALKLIVGLEAHHRGRFLREVKALVRLRHPHIVALRDAGDHEGRCFLVLDLIEGVSLQERIDTGGPLSTEATRRIALHLAEAVEHAHGQDVLHRDLAPKNVIMDGDAPRLTDFGLARDVDPSGRSSLTKTGTFTGTPGYWAPEQAQGRPQDMGPWTDVYGLGGILYCMLTGEPPYTGGSLVELLMAHEQPPTPPRELRPEVDRGLEAICLRCLEREPGARYPSAAELASALRDHRPGRAGSRPPWPWAVAAVAALGVALGVVLSRDGDPPATEPAPAAEQPREPTPDAAEALAQADAALAQGVWTEAEAAATRALESTADDDLRVVALRFRAEARLRAAEWERADVQEAVFADLDRALALRPRDPRALGLRAYARLTPQVETWLTVAPDVVEAVGADADAALADDPDEPVASIAKAMLEWREQQNPIARLRRVQSIHGRFYAEACLMRAVIDFPTADEQLAACLRTLPETVGWGRIRAHALLLQSVWHRTTEPPDLEAAKASILASLEARPTYAPTHWHRGGLRSGQGDLQGALESFERAIELGPPLPEYFVDRAELLIRLDATPEQFAECSEQLALARRLQKRGRGRISGTTILYWRARCEILAGNGSSPKVLFLLSQANAEDPSDQRVIDLLSEQRRLAGGD